MIEKLRENLKECSKCKTNKSLSDFKFEKRSGRYIGVCKICVNLRSRVWKNNNKQKVHSYPMKKFGMDIEDYFLILSKQDFVCKICKNPETTSANGKIRNLSVDHCHLTGFVRGLLCQKCNLSLGLFGDNIQLLESAIKYLEDSLRQIDEVMNE